MGTNHRSDFVDEEVFSKAYSFACSNSPFDYQIRWRVHQAIWLGLSAQKRFPNASFVELGTGRGFVMQAVLHAIEGTVGKEAVPQTFLYDTFQPFDTDGISQQSAQFGVNIHYTKSKSETLKNFSTWDSRVCLIEGTLPDTLKPNSKMDISFLHVDLNAAEVEARCLRILWELIPQGGLVLLDDYANAGFSETISPVRDFFAEMSQYVFTTPSGQGIVIKS
jgi:hypothetical protein